MCPLLSCLFSGTFTPHSLRNFMCTFNGILLILPIIKQRELKEGTFMYKLMIFYHFFAVQGAFLTVLCCPVFSLDPVLLLFFVGVLIALIGVLLPLVGVLGLNLAGLLFLSLSTILKPQTFFVWILSSPMTFLPLYLMIEGSYLDCMDPRVRKSTAFVCLAIISSQQLAIYQRTLNWSYPNSLVPEIQLKCIPIQLMGYLTLIFSVTKSQSKFNSISSFKQISLLKLDLLILLAAFLSSNSLTSFLILLISSIIFQILAVPSLSSISCYPFALLFRAVYSIYQVPINLSYLCLFDSFYLRSYFYIFLRSFVYCAFVTFSFLTHMWALLDVTLPMDMLAMSQKVISFLLILSSSSLRKYKYSNSLLSCRQSLSRSIPFSSSIFIFFYLLIVYCKIYLDGVPISRKQSIGKGLLPRTIELSTYQISMRSSCGSMQQANLLNSSLNYPILSIWARFFNFLSSAIQFLMVRSRRKVLSLSSSCLFLAQRCLVIQWKLYFPLCGNYKLVVSLLWFSFLSLIISSLALRPLLVLSLPACSSFFNLGGGLASLKKNLCMQSRSLISLFRVSDQLLKQSISFEIFVFFAVKIYEQSFSISTLYPVTIQLQRQSSSRRNPSRRISYLYRINLLFSCLASSSSSGCKFYMGASFQMQLIFLNSSTNQNLVLFRMSNIFKNNNSQ